MQIFAPHAKDFYKSSHVHQYPTGTSYAYANFTPRNGNHSNVPNDKGVVFVGLQLFMKDFLIKDWKETFFDKPKEKVCRKYYRRIKNAVGRDLSIKHIEDLHDLGFLPIAIKALPEGYVVPYGVPFFTIFNTLPNFFWLPNMLESVLSADNWGVCTSATTSNEYRKMFEHYAIVTGGDLEFIPFQGHDFSFRGLFGRQATALSGFGHLASGMAGTDSIPAIDAAEDFYGADSDLELVGGSVDATEHSVMCAGEKDSEIETFKRLILELYPDGIVSIVSDTWDFWQVITEFLPELYNEIMGRDGKVVIRPDSGDPVRIICGYTEDEVMRTSNGKVYIKTYVDGHCVWGDELMECEVKGLIQCLWDTFGGTTTEKGFKVLDSHIGAIYGDSITYGRAKAILERLIDKDFASTNIVLGIGSYTFQLVTRDTHGMAMKATYVVVNDEGREIFKDPKTDDGIKKSAKGLLRVDFDKDVLVLTDQCTIEQEKGGELQEVFRDSVITKEWTLQQIRDTVRSFD